MNSRIAFIKLIFNLIDKDKKGSLPVSDVLKEMKLDEQILNDLGYLNEEEFFNLLENFPTERQNYITEQELVAFLLSRSDSAEEYLYKYKNNMEKANMREENDFQFNNYEYEHRAEEYEMENQKNEEEEEELPGMDTKKFEFLREGSTEERLDKLKESMSRSSSKRAFYSSKKSEKLKKFNSNLTKDLKNKISQKSKVAKSYQDYQDFQNKYKQKSSLNFTVPKPFEFLKKDYHFKKMEKIQQMKERKKKTNFLTIDLNLIN